MPPAAPLIVLAALLPTLAAVANAEETRRWPAADIRVPLTPGHLCDDWQGSYTPGGAYEANLRLLAATIPAKVNADSCNCSYGNTAGDSPDRVVASAFCSWRPDASSPDCGACVALAFREAQRLCPYHRMAEVVVDGGACKAYFHDYDLMEEYQHAPIIPGKRVHYRVPLTPGHVCDDWQGSYTPGGAYEANLRLLAATIPAKVNADSCNCSYGNTAGDSPDRVVASAFCSWRPDASSPDCGACVALAFREAQRLCPYHRMAEVVVDGGACKAYFHDYDLMEEYQHAPIIPDNGGEVEYNNEVDFDPIASS